MGAPKQTEILDRQKFYGRNIEKRVNKDFKSLCACFSEKI